MIMKKVINSLFVIIAAMVTFAGCAKQEIDAPATVETKAVQFFAESIETKTHFGEKNDENKYPTLWDAGDKVKVLLNLEQISGVSGLEKTVTAEISSDAKSARFVAELNSTYEFDAYTFYAVVPSTAYNTKNATEGKLTVVIPDTQKPQETSVDKSAQVLYAVSSTTNHFPTSVQMDFKHFVAYGKLSLANLTDKVTSISSVKLSFEENVAGKWNYLVADGSIEAKEATKEIVLNTTSTENIWFACAPVDMSGKKMTVTVNTDKGPLSKEVTFPADRKFESGKISVLTINMAGIDPDEQGESDSYYEKVTSEPADWSGKYLIVWGNNAHATLSSKDLKATCSVTIVDDKIAATDAVNAAAMTVTESGENYNMTYPDGKYFAVAHNSSSSSTSAFSLSFAYTDSGVKISGKATNSGTTSTYILYNNQNQYYRCYVDKSDNSQYTLPSLYKLVEGDDSGETPEPTTPVLTVTGSEINIDAAGGTGEISYSVVNPVEGISVVASPSADWMTDFNSSTAGKVTFTVEENTEAEERTATVTLSYEGAESKTVTVKQAAKEVIEENDFYGTYAIVALRNSESLYYYLTNVVTSSSTKRLTAVSAGNVLPEEGVKVNSDKLWSIVKSDNVYTIKSVASGEFISWSSGNSATLSESGLEFTITKNEDGTYLLQNATRFLSLNSTKENNYFALYEGTQSQNLYLIQATEGEEAKPELTSIEVAPTKTKFTVGDNFGFEGTVTAKYSNGTTEDVTESATFSGYDMSQGGTQTVIVTYIEGEISQTTNYTITVEPKAIEPEEPSTTSKFVKVTSAPTDWTGTYLIVCESENIAFDGSRTTMDATGNIMSVTITNGEIEATDAMKNITFNIANSGSAYTIQSKSGYYIGQTSNANGLKSSTTTSYNNTLSISDSNVDFVSGGAYLRYNAASDQKRFRYYKSSSYTGQKAIQLYKLVD